MHVLRIFSSESRNMWFLRNVSSYLSNQAVSRFMRKKNLIFFVHFFIRFKFGIYSFDMQSKYIWEEQILLDVIDTMNCKLTVSKAQNVSTCYCLQETFQLIVYGKYLSLGRLKGTYCRWRKGIRMIGNYIIKWGFLNKKTTQKYKYQRMNTVIAQTCSGKYTCHPQ